MTKQKKRDLFSELKQSIKEIQEYKNTENMTLRTHFRSAPSVLTISISNLVKIW